MQNTRPQDTFTQDAMSVVGAPRYVIINGKKMSPSVLFSPALAESMLYWLSQSESYKLFGKNILDVTVVADSSRISYSRIDRMSHLAAHAGTADMGLGLATSLLVVSHAMEQILRPSRLDASFDYESLILSFRGVVARKYGDGDEVKPGDIQLNTTFYDNINGLSIKGNGVNRKGPRT